MNSMRMFIFICFLVSVIILFPFSLFNQSSADSWEPSHGCSKPYKPYQFNSRWELDDFMADVDSYKRCILNFIEEQEEAVENHQNAAEDAIEDWNRFVNYELN